MSRTFPVLWTMGEDPVTGMLRLEQGRITLVARERTLSFPVDVVSQIEVLREPAQRLRRMPVIALEMSSGASVRIASLGGPGSMHELAVAIGERRDQPMPSGA